jgi:hypothetical protein
LKIHLTVSVVNNEPVELFIKCNQAGSLERGLLHSLALVVSLAIRGGVSWRRIAEKLQLMQFEPQGPTGNAMVPWALSVSDYIGKWLVQKFGDKE